MGSKFYLPEEILDIVKPESMGFKLVSFVADGGSQFRALAYLETGSQSGHLPIREKVVAHMRANPSAYTQFMPIKVGDPLRRNPSRSGRRNTDHAFATQADVDGRYNVYLDHVAVADHPGDSITLQAFAAAFNADLLIVKQDGYEIIRAIEGATAGKVYPMAFIDATQQYCAVNGNSGTSIKELLGKLSESNKDVGSSSPLKSSEDGNPPFDSDAAPSTTKTTPEPSANLSPEPATPLRKTVHDELAWIDAPLELSSRKVSPAPDAIRGIARPSIQTPVKHYLRPSVQKKDTFVKPKRKQTEEALCMVQKKPKTNRAGTPTTTSIGPVNSNSNIQSTTTGTKRPASSTDCVESAPNKKQKPSYTTVAGTKRPAPSDFVVSAPLKKQKPGDTTAIRKATAELSSPVTQGEIPLIAVPRTSYKGTARPSTRSSVPAANTNTKEPEKPKAISRGPFKVTKKSTLFPGAKPVQQTRTYRTERIAVAPAPTRVLLTTSATVPPPPSSSVSKKTSLPAKKKLEKQTAAKITNAFTKKTMDKKIEKKYNSRKRVEKTAGTRFYDPSAKGPGVATISGPGQDPNALEKIKLLKKDMDSLPKWKQAQVVAKEALKQNILKIQARSNRHDLYQN